jgi:hypothetical protein
MSASLLVVGPARTSLLAAKTDLFQTVHPPVLPLPLSTMKFSKPTVSYIHAVLPQTRRVESPCFP